jgi:hypothetical protein
VLYELAAFLPTASPQMLELRVISESGFELGNGTLVFLRVLPLR